MKKKIFVLLIIFISTVNICFAHRGRTDSSGGHYDTSTGEYHYHHGYSAHQHNNGICPYESNSINSKVYTCTNCKEEITKDAEKCPKCGYNLKSSTTEQNKPRIVKITDMTEEERKEWEKQYKERYQEGLNRKQQEIEEANKSFNDLLDENTTEKQPLMKKVNQAEKQNKTSNIVYFIGILFTIIIIIYIIVVYNTYKKLKNE